MANQEPLDRAGRMTAALRAWDPLAQVNFDPATGKVDVVTSLGVHRTLELLREAGETVELNAVTEDVGGGGCCGCGCGSH